MSPWARADEGTDLPEGVVDLTEDVVDLTEEQKEQEPDGRENGIQDVEVNGKDSDVHQDIDLQDEEVAALAGRGAEAGAGQGQHAPEPAAPCSCASVNADKPYPCDTCGKRFTKLKYLRKHERTHYKNLLAQSDVSPSEAQRDSARKKKLAQESNLKKQESNLKKQESNLKEQESKSTRELRYPCSLCDVAFALLITLKAHVRQTHPGKRPQFYCSDCKKPFLRHTSLRRHERTHDSNSYKFSCGVCPRKFAVYQSLQSHILRMHRPCEDGSNAQGSEKQSKRSSVIDNGAHAEEKPYTCGMCNEGFDRLSPFKEHARVHM